MFVEEANMIRDIVTNIFEEKQVGEIYHFMTYEDFMLLLQKNILKPIEDKEAAKQREWYVPFTRDFKFWDEADFLKDCPICVVVDGTKLSNRALIRPFSHYLHAQDLTTGAEWVYTTAIGIENMGLYITSIRVKKDLFSNIINYEKKHRTYNEFLNKIDVDMKFNKDIESEAFRDRVLDKFCNYISVMMGKPCISV